MVCPEGPETESRDALILWCSPLPPGRGPPKKVRHGRGLMRAQAGLPGMESQEKPQRKPEGGFAFFSVTQLVMAWTAFREGQIGLKDLRVYFALAEMKSRRCGCGDDDPPPEFTPLEVRKLIGGAGGEREAVNKLLAVGLLREVSKSTIEFATDPGELRF